MALDKEKIQQRLAELEVQITEVRKRMPAHSIKPPIIHELLELEDEQELLLARLAKLS